MDLPRHPGHWTRVGAILARRKENAGFRGFRLNVDDPDTTPGEKNRADMLEFNPDGPGSAFMPPGYATRAEASRSIRRRANCGAR